MELEDFSTKSQKVSAYLSVFKSIPLSRVAKIANLPETQVARIMNNLLQSQMIQGEYKDGVFYRDLPVSKKKKEVLFKYLNSSNQISLDSAARTARLSKRQVTTLINTFLKEGVIKGKLEGNYFINFAVESRPSEEVEVKREYDYIGGNIRFKIVVRNLTKLPITKIKVMLNVSDQYIIDAPVKSIETLLAGETRGVDFILSPLTCGTSNIFGTLSYTDPFNEAHSITIKPKAINVKCPLVVPAEATSNEIATWRNKLLKGASSIQFHEIPAKQAFQIACDQIAALDLTQIEYDASHYHATFAGIAKVTGNKLVISTHILGNEIKLMLWTRDLKEATGFLAYIKNLIATGLQVTQKLRIHVEQIGQKILYTLEIIDRLFTLAHACERRVDVHEVLLLLKEIKLKIKKHFEKDQYIKFISKWEDELSVKFDETDLLEEYIAGIFLDDLIKWIKDFIKLTETNLKIYSESFKENAAELTKISAKINEIQAHLRQIEENYSKSILRYLMVLNKDSGIVMYSQAFGGFEFDEDLVSGFLTAISSFGVEVSKKETIMKAIQYQDFEIIVEGGKYSRVALVLKGHMTDLLHSKLSKFIKKFEEVYRDELESWTGDVSALEDTDYLVYQIFGMISREDPNPDKPPN
ncbi:MAG: hypothetical protein ACTSRS_04790 [Candidatus Helarchaeota archaeon]